MRAFLIACALLSLTLPARADEPADERNIESINDFGGAWTLRGDFDHSVLTHFVLSQDSRRDAAEAFYGPRWSPRTGMSFALLAGFGYANDGWGPVLSIHKLMATRDLAWRMEFESYLRPSDDWSYEGYYAFDFMVGGVHLMNDGMDFGYGAHLGSGHGLHPFKFEVRITAGATDGMPDMTGAFYMGLDFH